jgi:hypothetical protein
MRTLRAQAGINVVMELEHIVLPAALLGRIMIPSMAEVER